MPVGQCVQNKEIKKVGAKAPTLTAINFAIDLAARSTKTAATVESASASREASSTVESTIASVEPVSVKSTCAAEAASAGVAATVAIPVAASVAVAGATVETVPISVTVVSASIKVIAIIKSVPVEAVEPRADSDENAVHKVVRSVVAVRSACVRIVAVVSVWTHRRWANYISGADSNPDAHGDLCRSDPRNKQQSTKYYEAFQVFHISPPARLRIGLGPEGVPATQTGGALHSISTPNVPSSCLVDRLTEALLFFKYAGQAKESYAEAALLSIASYQ